MVASGSSSHREVTVLQIKTGRVTFVKEAD